MKLGKIIKEMNKKKICVDFQHHFGGSVQEGGHPSQYMEAVMNESINCVAEIGELTYKIFGVNTAI